jgi:DNA-binding NarL/FixJ family response regulator
MIRIVIADDHTVLRQGVRALLSSVDGWNVVGEASDGLEVVPLVEKHVPDVVIVDLSMPNLGGVEAISRMQKLKTKPQIVVLSAKEDDHSVTDAMKAGATAYVTKSSGVDELQFAIRAVLKGQSYLSPAVCSALLRSERMDGASGPSPLAELSSREREVMKLLSEGRPNREVAKILHISPRTVDSHRANILRKLGVTSNAELVQIAIRCGLVE